MLFCVGLVTGGTLIGVGNKLFSKWILILLLKFFTQIIKTLTTSRNILKWKKMQERIKIIKLSSVKILIYFLIFIWRALDIFDFIGLLFDIWFYWAYVWYLILLGLCLIFSALIRFLLCNIIKKPPMKPKWAKSALNVNFWIILL